MGGVSIQNVTRRPTPRLPYARAAELALPGWDISLVFVGDTRARALNARLRGKDYIPNVLSYEVGAKSGEVIICLAQAAREAPDFEMSYSSFVLHLFIHGLLHLKGYPHSARMERRERTIAARVAAPLSRLHPTPPLTHGTTHSNGHRHRHAPGQTGRRRRGR